MISKFNYVSLLAIVYFIVKTNSKDTFATTSANCPDKYMCCATCTKQCCGSPSDLSRQECEDDCHGMECSSDDECGDDCCEYPTHGKEQEGKRCATCSKWVYTVFLPVFLGVLFISTCVIVVLGRRKYARKQHNVIGVANVNRRSRQCSRRNQPFTVESHQFNHVPCRPRQNVPNAELDTDERPPPPYDPLGGYPNNFSAPQPRPTLCNTDMPMELTCAESYTDGERHAPPSYNTLEGYSNIASSSRPRHTITNADISMDELDADERPPPYHSLEGCPDNIAPPRYSLTVPPQSN